MNENAMTDEKLIVRPSVPLCGETTVPGDKSISHRAVLFGALARGTTQVRGWLAAGDTEASLNGIQALGVPVERHDSHTLTIHGGAFKPADGPLNLVNAGTGIRLLAGIMAGQPFPSILDGSVQLRRRPMQRVIGPLQMMGANIHAKGGHAPLYIKPAELHGIKYRMPVASAQVKSAVLLAGLFAGGATAVVQPGPARDHTERMLRAMGADLAEDGNTVILTSQGDLKPMDLTVPGDFSSAAFLIVAALLVPGSDVILTGVNLNPTRTGLLDILLEMGADITVTETGLEAGEPVGQIRARHSQLKGVEIGGDMVVRMIDEFPILMIAALCAEGKTTVRDAQELRVKETDRLAVMTEELSKLGAVIRETTDGFQIVGPQEMTGAIIDGHDDHRIAMSLTIAGLLAAGETIVTDAKCAGDSFPGFAQTLAKLGASLMETGAAHGAG
jgi:3-phosphoshikimate 1-carboxyvinyltransferase